MADSLRRVGVRMILPDLSHLPGAMLPPGHTWRTFRPDAIEEDIDLWLHVGKAAFPDNGFDREWFYNEYISKPHWDPERIVMIFAGDEPASICSAWSIDPDEREVGLIHWVGTHPDHKGKHLGKIAALICLHWLRRRGFRAAILNTDSFRIPALKIYLQLGFHPCYKRGAGEDVWQEIFDVLGYPPRPPAQVGRWGDPDLP